MKNEWIVRKNGLLKNVNENFGPRNPFLKCHIFGQGHSAHACKIWAGSDEKWMSSSQKNGNFFRNIIFKKIFGPQNPFLKI